MPDELKKINKQKKSINKFIEDKKNVENEEDDKPKKLLNKFIEDSIEEIENIIISVPKPLLKWVGGKTQIINNIFKYFPKEMNNYHEIFIGGGSVLITLLYLKQNNIIKINGKIYAYDLNDSLINLYKNIQINPDELYKKLNNIIKQYESYEDKDKGTSNRKPNTINDVDSKESYYYWIRKKYNESNITSIDNSVYFIFLNKTCFRGLFRTGKNGFNVPYGNYKNPGIIDKKHLLIISNLIKDVEFINSDFSNSIIRAKKNDFLYLDPPYVPENDKSFVGYTSSGFSLEKHLEFFDMCHELKKNKINFVLSNADVKLIRDNFKNYTIESIVCKRAINSKKPDSKTNEVIISYTTK